MKKQKVIGLCKALTCGDFIPAVLEGIYDFLDEIIFVYPDRKWDGSIAKNEVCGAVREWKFKNDYALKITQWHTELIDQNEQYGWAIDKICKEAQPDWIFIFDTDEVWDAASMGKLVKRASELTYENALYCKMHTYIKSPLYRIEPEEPCTPCVMVRGIPEIFRGVRGNQSRPGTVLDGLKFHHFSYVRNTDEEVFEKAILSTGADGLQTVNMSEWKAEKWNQLPNSINLHTTKKCEDFWKGVRVIDKRELPEAVLELEIFKRSVK